MASIEGGNIENAGVREQQSLKIEEIIPRIERIEKRLEQIEMAVAGISNMNSETNTETKDMVKGLLFAERKRLYSEIEEIKSVLAEVIKKSLCQSEADVVYSPDYFGEARKLMIKRVEYQERLEAIDKESIEIVAEHLKHTGSCQAECNEKKEALKGERENLWEECAILSAQIAKLIEAHLRTYISPDANDIAD